MVPDVLSCVHLELACTKVQRTVGVILTPVWA